MPKAEANSRSCSGGGDPGFSRSVAGEQKLELHPARGGERIGLDQRDHALVGEHAPDIGRGDGRRRLEQRHEMLGVDAGAGDQLDACQARRGRARISCRRVLHDGRLPCRLSRALSAATTSGRVARS